MRINIKIYFLLFLISTLFIIVSCEKENINKNNTEVAFEISNPYFSDKKESEDDPIPQCTDLPATHIKIKLLGPEYPQGKELILELISNSAYESESQTITLKEGVYKVLSLKVYSRMIDKDSLIWIAPKEGSEYEQALNLKGVYSEMDKNNDDDNGTFELRRFTKNKINFDVLCYEPSDFEKYGFEWDEYFKYEKKYIEIHGNISCPDLFKSWHVDGFYSRQGEDVNPESFPAIFKASIYDETGKLLGSSTNESSFGMDQGLILKYVNNKLTTDEKFRLKIDMLTKYPDIDPVQNYRERFETVFEAEFYENELASLELLTDQDVLLTSKNNKLNFSWEQCSEQAPPSPGEAPECALFEDTETAWAYFYGSDKHIFEVLLNNGQFDQKNLGWAARADKSLFSSDFELMVPLWSGVGENDIYRKEAKLVGYINYSYSNSLKEIKAEYSLFDCYYFTSVHTHCSDQTPDSTTEELFNDKFEISGDVKMKNYTAVFYYPNNENIEDNTDYWFMSHLVVRSNDSN